MKRTADQRRETRRSEAEAWWDPELDTIDPEEDMAYADGPKPRLPFDRPFSDPPEEETEEDKTDEEDEAGDPDEEDEELPPAARPGSAGSLPGRRPAAPACGTKTRS